MQKMTLHEAKRLVALYAGQAGIDPDRLDWSAPAETALTCFAYASNAGPIAGPAAHRIGRVLLAHDRHLAFEAGRQFSDKATARHARRMAAFHVADEIDAGLHYAEEIHQ